MAGDEIRDLMLFIYMFIYVYASSQGEFKKGDCF